MRDVVKTNIDRPKNSKRIKRRRRNMSAYYFLVLLLVLGVGITLSMTLLFNIREITVNGDAGYSSEEIISAAGVSTGDNLVRLRSSEIQDNVVKHLINVDEVNVKKEFPDQLIIEVTKSMPAANVEYSGGYLLVSTKGRILANNTEPAEGAVLVKGLTPVSPETGGMLETEDEQQLKIYNNFFAEITKQGITQIKEIDLTDKYEITMNYDGRITVEIGNSTNLAYKLEYTKKVLSENIEADKKGYFIFIGTNEASFISEEDMAAYKSKINQPAVTEATGTGDNNSVNTETAAEYANE